MKLTVNLISNTLDMSIEETLDTLEANGIYVKNPNDALSVAQIEKIKNIIKNLKNEENSNNKTTLEHRCKLIIEQYVKNYKIFIDTCSLMNENIDKFYNNIYPYLKQYNNKIIVPSRVVDELRKHVKSNNKNKQTRAIRGMNVLKTLYDNNLLEIRGESTDNFADNVFLVVFTKFRMKYNLLLITQDNDLGKEISDLNKSQAVKGEKVLAKRINKYGFLSNVGKINNSTNTNDNNENPYVRKHPKMQKFEKATEVIKLPNEKIRLTYEPKENDILNTGSGSKITLIKKLASGGEGSVYTTNTEYVAKIYKKDKLNREKLEKIKLMVSKKVEWPGICWPLETLYNSKNEFVGYLMPRAAGKEMQKLFLAKPVLLKNMPTWKKRDTVELCITILKKIRNLHKRNIILGDINPLNILIVSSTEVYFVDTDSYQIEGFPCPVGTIPFTAQEILLEDIEYKNKYNKDRKYSEYLRTIENENFSVAVLLFMIMLPGKNPYSLQGGDSIKNNILNMDFAYPLGENSNKRTPDGPWKFIWSHLTYSVKEAFYETFTKGGKFSTPETRLTVKDWLKIMKKYLYLLDSGKFAKQDEMSLELFPTRRKKVKGIEYKECRLCHNEVMEDSLKEGICSQCLRKEETYKCSRCGKDLVFSNYNKYIRHEKKIALCRDCREVTKNRPTSSNTISQNVKFATHKATFENKYNCFITTAVCEYFNKEDDCYELTTLRQYRDNWLRYQADGVNLIKEYYNTAPVLVEKLNKNPLKDCIYHKLWTDYISVCLKLIENKKYEECKIKYIEMVNYLKNICLMKGGDCYGR